MSLLIKSNLINVQVGVSSILAESLFFTVLFFSPTTSACTCAWISKCRKWHLNCLCTFGLGQIQTIRSQISHKPPLPFSLRIWTHDTSSHPDMTSHTSCDTFSISISLLIYQSSNQHRFIFFLYFSLSVSLPFILPLPLSLSLSPSLSLSIYLSISPTYSRLFYRLCKILQNRGQILIMIIFISK